jgi:hypothetical protein
MPDDNRDGVDDNRFKVTCRGNIYDRYRPALWDIIDDTWSEYYDCDETWVRSGRRTDYCDAYPQCVPADYKNPST